MNGLRGFSAPDLQSTYTTTTDSDGLFQLKVKVSYPFTTIVNTKLKPQTGFTDWNQDFPNPVDFYGVLLDGHSVTPTNNENFGQTNDSHINSQVAKLGATPQEITRMTPRLNRSR